MKSQSRVLLSAALFALVVSSPSLATETENFGMRTLPAPAKMTIDGKFDDWDLSAGIFDTPDAETMRDTIAIWIHTQYDADYFYILGRFRDETPLDNPGQTIADYGFQADSLQFRTITRPGTKEECGNHFTGWKGIDGADVIKVERGVKFERGVLPDAKKLGALQAFSVDADGKGYSHEIAIPWKLLTLDEKPLVAGDRMRLTFEPNFTVGRKGRLTVKSLFQPGEVPDRVFTFMASRCWGTATMMPKGKVAPQPVRLADGREFPVTLVDGLPKVDWTGLIKSKELKGFKDISYTMPEDGNISLHILDSEGTVVRQLLNNAFFTKGQHTVKWDGLSNHSLNIPGGPLPPGQYTYRAIWHTGIGLRLVGFASNGGAAPWDGPSGKDNWGGDHGVPIAAAADAKQVYLAWSGAEAGKAVLACDLNGKVQWSNIRAGIAGAKGIASDGKTVYVLGGASGPDNDGAAIYKLSAKDGSYQNWADSATGKGTGSADLRMIEIWKGTPLEFDLTPRLTGKTEAARKQPKPEYPPQAKANAIAAHGGKIYLSFAKSNRVAMLDATSGKLLADWEVAEPGYLAVDAKGILRVVSAGSSILTLDPASGKTAPVVAGLEAATGIALDKEGRLFVATRSPDNQIHVYSSDGKKEASIGKAGGRPILGKWDTAGIAFAGGIAVDSAGKVWVAEVDTAPKRFSAWDGDSGKLVKEFFGPTAYGALGGAILPTDPLVMVGQGCEWKIDPATGRADVTRVITRSSMETSRFGTSKDGRVYLATCNSWIHGPGKTDIFERLADGSYVLRSRFSYAGKDKTDKKMSLWADVNGDAQEQPEEVTTVDGWMTFTHWSMQFSPNMSITTREKQLLPVQGFTKCGAPIWDIKNPKVLPDNGVASADDSLLLSPGAYGKEHTEFQCFDIASGKLRWTYPDNFVGVHGSHKATPAEIGLIRGSFPANGVAKLPAPIGNIWMIGTNVGEWHILTGDGFYLSRLFQPDPLKVRWPETAVPGAVMDNAPCGMGGEDFGGSIAYAKDGNLYVQAGKTGYWNLKVTGLDTVKSLPGGSVTLSETDPQLAGKLREQLLQTAIGKQRLGVRPKPVTLTGDPRKDFADCQAIAFEKQKDAAVRAMAAYDDKSLFLAWEVKDATPWVNGAEAPEMMYLGGDTVDFQLGTDPKASAARDKAVLGDLRISIGNLKGTPTAVIYRLVATEKQKQPFTFSSGVIKEYVMESVRVLKDAQIVVKKKNNEYLVEAAIPLAELGLATTSGLILRGDFGATHGDPAGKRTRLRTYWSNQTTGIVDDAVFELMMEPKNWGELEFLP